MREIVHVQIGNCGNVLGTLFWEHVISEHLSDVSALAMQQGISTPPSSERSVFLRETAAQPFVPRSICIDADPSTRNVIQGSLLGTHCPAQQLIWGTEGCGNNWAKGHYKTGIELLPSVLEAVRKEVERCDSLQGFQFFHSVSAGTGGGIGSLLSVQLRDLYSHSLQTDYVVFPAPVLCPDCVVQPYNATFTICELLGTQDLAFVFDNPTLLDLVFRQQQVLCPTYSHLNVPINSAIRTLTTLLRYSGHPIHSLRQLAVQLVPQPKMQFISLWEARPSLSTMAEMAEAWLNPHAGLSGAALKADKLLSAYATFASPLPREQVEQQFAKLPQAHPTSFAPWLQDMIKHRCINPVRASKLETAVLVGCSSGTHKVLQTIHEQFNAMYKRRAFCRYYLEEGMEYNQFEDYASQLCDIISAYKLSAIPT